MRDRSAISPVAACTTQHPSTRAPLPPSSPFLRRTPPVLGFWCARMRPTCAGLPSEACPMGLHTTPNPRLAARSARPQASDSLVRLRAALAVRPPTRPRSHAPAIPAQ